MSATAPILIEQARGDYTENYHRGSVAIANANGDLLFSLGDPEERPFTRSSMKPIQALPFVEMWGEEVSMEEIAIACASHSGEEIHRRTVARILDRINATPDKLQCGVQIPMDEETKRELIRTGRSPDVLHHNCSGKHSAMLATAYKYGEPFEEYFLPEHPVQQRIRARVARYCEDTLTDIATAMDHCSVVTWGPTLRGMATAYARLGEQSGRFGKNVELVRRAMTGFPEYVAGSHKRIDTDLMRFCGGLLAKAGAAGYYSMGWHDSSTGMGLGIAIKMWDGDPIARDALSVCMLEGLGILPEHWGSKTGWGAREVKNFAGRHVGEIRASLTLKQALKQFTSPVSTRLF